MEGKTGLAVAAAITDEAQIFVDRNQITALVDFEMVLTSPTAESGDHFLARVKEKEIMDSILFAEGEVGLVRIEEVEAASRADQGTSAPVVVAEDSIAERESSAKERKTRIVAMLLRMAVSEAAGMSTCSARGRGKRAVLGSSDENLATAEFLDEGNGVV